MVLVLFFSHALAGVGLAAERENDIRCCLRADELRKVFLVTLVKKGDGQAHLQIVDPDGRIYGYRPRDGKIIPPNETVIYASGPRDPEDILDPQIHKRRNYHVIIRKLMAGEYTLQIIGIAAGRYGLSFHPGGMGDSADTRFFGTSSGIPLSKGEVHTYTFNGSFADIHDYSIRLDDPRRFTVKRENQ
ncbi:MAG: hypothetical protein R6X27_06465 [Candidatus Desulfacyla sp.]